MQSNMQNRDLEAVALPLSAAPSSASPRLAQSGIIGSVTGGRIIATPAARESVVLPNRVRVYTADFPYQLVAEVETEVRGDLLWHFEVWLQPGDYLLVANAPPGPDNGYQWFSPPVRVTVEKEQFTQLPPLSFGPRSSLGA